MAVESSSTFRPKYRVIYEKIRTQIVNGEYTPGQTLPTQQSLVAHYGASLSTVRQSLAELVNEGLVRPKPGSGFFVQDKDTAQKATNGVMSSNFLYVAYYTYTNVFDQKLSSDSLVLAGISSVSHGDKLIKAICHMNCEPDEMTYRMMAEEVAKCSGAICTPGFKPELLRQHCDPSRIVMLGHGIPNEEISDFHHVTIDADVAGYMAAQMLLLKGHRHIALQTATTITDYYACVEGGAARALAEAGVEFSAKFCIDPTMDHLAQEKLVYEPMVAARNVTAILAIGDHSACRIVLHINQTGRRVPEDVSVVCVGGLHQQQLMVPGLSRVNIGYEQQGAAAAKILVDRHSERPVHRTLGVVVEPGSTIASR